jgi:hypothetical protein
VSFIENVFKKDIRILSNEFSFIVPLRNEIIFYKPDCSENPLIERGTSSSEIEAKSGTNAE